MPRTSDGKTIFLPSLFRGDLELNFVGAGDNGVSNRGGGQAFMASRSAAGDEVVIWNTADWVYVAGGGVLFGGAVYGDWMTFEVGAPKTVVTANGGGTGNANKIDVGGINLIIPAAGDGAWDVVDADKVPVPAIANDGHWDWDVPDVDKGVVTPSPNSGEAQYNLFDDAVVLTRWVTKMPILGSGQVDFKVSSIKPKRILPHWEYKVVLHNIDGAHTVEAVWNLFTGRKKTT